MHWILNELISREKWVLSKEKEIAGYSYAWGQSRHRTKTSIGKGCSTGKKKPSKFLMEHEGWQDGLDSNKPQKQSTSSTINKFFSTRVPNIWKHAKCWGQDKKSGYHLLRWMILKKVWLENSPAAQKAAIKHKEILRVPQSLAPKSFWNA